MRVYVASWLANIDRVRTFNEALRAAGHEVTYDWTVHGPVWDRGAEVLEQTARAEARGVLAADAVVVLLPGGRGTHFELGLAYGAHLTRSVAELRYGAGSVRIVLVGDREQELTGPTTCAFYHLPAIEWAADETAALALLAGAAP